MALRSFPTRRRPASMEQLAAAYNRGGGFGDGRRRQYRQHFDEGDRLRQSRGRVRSTVRVATAARGVLPRHCKTVQAQYSPRTDAAAGRARPGLARRRRTTLLRVAARGLHPDGRRLRPDNGVTRLRAWFASVAMCAPGLDDGCGGRTRQAGTGLRPRRVAAGFDGSTWHGHTVRTCRASHGDPPGRVHPTGRASGNRLRGLVCDRRLVDGLARLPGTCLR